MNFQAYNEESIRNLQINNVAENLFEDGRLLPPQYEQVKTDFPVTLNQPNLFVRVGLFLFTTLCIIFSMGFGAFIFGNMNLGQTGFGVLSILFGIVLIVVNEHFIRDRHWYRQGSDNALCYASISCLVAGLTVLFHINDFGFIALLSCLLLSFATVRYGDPLLALAAFYALIISFFTLINDNNLPRLALPFVGVTLSVLIYYLTKTASKRDDLFYWANCFTVLEIASLFVLYASVNYYMVSSFYQNDADKGIPTPFNWLFGLATAVLPLIYLASGIKTKDRILWIMGGLGIVASILTYRYYHALLPIEYALTMAGAALLALAILGIKYLKTPRNGFVYLPKPSKSNLAESLLMNQLLQHAAHSSTPESHFKFGGGDFDGGGAEGEY